MPHFVPELFPITFFMILIFQETLRHAQFPDDVEIDTKNAKLVAIIIFGRPKCFGLFGREEDIVILWNNIELIGEDTIIVTNVQRPYKKKRMKLPFFK